MEWVELVLQYVRALAWPVLIGVALWWVRDPLEELIGRTQTASVGGADVTFFARQEAARLEAAVTEKVSEAAAPRPTGPPTGGTSEPVAGILARDVIEELVQVSAEWGAARARAGLSAAGAQIHWTDSGEPVLLPDPAPEHGGASNFATLERSGFDAFLAEARVKRILMARDSLPADAPTKDRDAIEAALAQERQKLATVDPMSPYLR